MNKTIFLGSDHGGFKLKEDIKKYLDSKNLKYEDLGTYDCDSVNYVVYAREVALSVSKFNGIGILCCSSGIGVSIAANKVIGVRAALCTSKFHAEFSRRHNDCNIICFGQKVSNAKDVIEMIDIFLNTPFDGGRHEVRVKSISDLELESVKHVNLV